MVNCLVSATEFFLEQFKEMKGRVPYPWQRKLFEQIVAGNWPQIVDMPTGAGKTAVLWVWWLALAWSNQQNTPGVPIRLAWVVNRRVVVDQVTSEVEELRSKARELGFEPPAVSTLRGALADTGEWRNDPTRPAVIVGTVDMIGSRLLFRGYRSGAYWRPVESGLLGVDTLIVNDEAHLTPAFTDLVRKLEAMSPAARIGGKCFRYMLLSATQDQKSDAVRFQHEPEEDARESERFAAVWATKKALTLREVANAPAQKSEFRKLCTEKPAPRTIVFIESPEKALEFYQDLVRDKQTATLMTGTMRGKERDDLANDEVFQLFEKEDPGEGPVFLVATSAAEVGVNLTCERMVSGLREADAMIQRFGRLNRFGNYSDGRRVQGEAHVVYVEPKKEERLQASLEYLKNLDGDISPRKLWAARPPDDAVSEKAKSPARLEMWRIESWAQTVYQDRDVAEVEPWVRGQQDDHSETELVWRADLKYLREWGISEKQVERVLDAFPVTTKEILREPSKRVFDKLQEIAGKLKGASDDILIVRADQTVQWERISNLKDDRAIRKRLLILPEHIGRVGAHGMFEPEAGAAEGNKNDVAGCQRARTRLLSSENGWSCLEPEAEFGVPDDDESIVAFARRQTFRAPFTVKNPESDFGDKLVYLRKRAQTKAGQLREISLNEHQEAVANRARELATRAGLGELAEQYFAAGLGHDEGKREGVWQRAMGAKDPPAAKTVAPANLALLGGYRHEFGSLVKTSGANENLVQHFIATHHAGGRSFFQSGAYGPLTDKAQCERVAREAEQRFARLQQQFGPWGLAYLEAIFKRADGLVSAQEGEGASG